MHTLVHPRHWRRTVAAAATALGIAATLLVADVAPAKADGGRSRHGYDILFIRHAHTNSGPGAIDPPLSDLGTSQASALAAQLHGERVDEVHTSMLLRAFQTGADVANDHRLPINADARLNEVSFDLSDIPADDRDALVKRLGDIMDRWSRGEDRDKGFGAESFNDVKARWDAWWKRFVAEHHTGKGTAAIVAHSALLTLMLPETCENPIDPEFRQANPIANTMIIRARLQPNGTLTCLTWGGKDIPSAQGAAFEATDSGSRQ
ncbi:histidine phosphatase family protein [Yinghuangia sp. ASG 101]|uniref:histidine phosphatase family protein n=1 Tax=Yinghuangia sp. ASG 101 TaxID=2896848 RepID=UPI001E365244|nr:histidine phosphatase family protein [Yinghuangia sp. ASG 101]UGQ10985.1 histidine phosphatase family protein [Yinghuangia sp. ASG 101]